MYNIHALVYVLYACMIYFEGTGSSTFLCLKLSCGLETLKSEEKNLLEFSDAFLPCSTGTCMS